MSNDNNEQQETQTTNVVRISIEFNTSTGQCLVLMPEKGNPLTLYGMCEFAKDQIRLALVPGYQRSSTRIIPGAMQLPGH